jgi:hypothetical protein
MTSERTFPIWQCSSAIADIDAATEYIGANCDEIRTSIREHSAILFRGFPLRGPSDFGRIVVAAGLELMDYRSMGGGGVRSSKSDRVYTTVDDIAPQARQSPHHERAKSSDITKIPSVLAFYCEAPAASGGETALCSSASVAERLHGRHPRLHAKLSESRLRYCKVLYDERAVPVAQCPVCRQTHASWQAAFGAMAKTDVVARARTDGGSLAFQDDDLVQRGGLSVFNGVATLDDGRVICWTHKLNERPCSDWIEYEDGTLMHYHEQECIRRIAIEGETRVRWRAGDFLVFDNFALQHSKCPHRGERRVYLTMGVWS